MKGLISLSFIFFLPGILLVVMSYFGVGHPLENTLLDEELTFLESSDNRVEVVFFGYAGCSFICPNALIKLGSVIDDMKDKDANIPLAGVFIDVNATLQLDRAKEYAEFFSTNIRGINTTPETLETFKSAFKIRIKDTFSTNGEIKHTDHFFVLKKKGSRWKIARVLNKNTSEANLKKIFKEELEY